MLDISMGHSCVLLDVFDITHIFLLPLRDRTDLSTRARTLPLTVRVRPTFLGERARALICQAGLRAALRRPLLRPRSWLLASSFRQFSPLNLMPYGLCVILSRCICIQTRLNVKFKVPAWDERLLSKTLQTHIQIAIKGIS